MSENNEPFADESRFIVRTVSEVAAKSGTLLIMAIFFIVGWFIGSFYATLSFPLEFFNIKLEKPIERPALTFGGLFLIPAFFVTWCLRIIGAMFFFKKDRRSPQIQDLYDSVDALTVLRKRGQISKTVERQEINTIVRDFANTKRDAIVAKRLKESDTA